MTDGQKIQWTLDLIQKLLDAKIGDPERLRTIKNTLETGKEVSDEEKNYLKEQFEELKNNPPETGEEIDETKISKNLIITEKLLEAEIGNRERLETIKKHLTNNESPSKEDDEYLKEKYEQLITIDDSEVQALERLDMVKKLQTAEIGNLEKLEKIQTILDQRKELSQEDESYLKTKFEQYKKITKEEPKVSPLKVSEKISTPKAFPGVNSPVTISVQVLFCFIPFLVFYAFYRIKKLRMSIVLGIVTFIPIAGVEFLIPFPYGFILSYILSWGIPIYFLVKWSREWNEMVLREQKKMFTNQKSPLDLLEERYAKGEITKEQFDKTKENLT